MGVGFENIAQYNDSERANMLIIIYS